MKIKSTKSQGISINVVIIAVLALVVLVVLTVIFTDKVKIFSEGLQSCAAKQGHCSDKCTDNEALIANANCPEGNDDKSKKLCCVAVFSNS